MTQSREPWFGRKRFGWGVGPRTWQGYLIVLVLAAAIVGGARFLNGA